MRVPLALACCLAAACCTSTPLLDEAALAREAKTVVHEAEFTLFSPYDTAATANYADSVRAEIEIVGTLFPDHGSIPVRLYLVPIAAEAGHEQELWHNPSQEGLKGLANEGDFALVYVTANIDGSSAFARAGFMRGGTLRHEITHLYAHRAGLFLSPWFEEGLALEVESMNADGKRLYSHPFPPHLLLARKSTTRGALSELLEWRRDDHLSREELSLRYVRAQALFRYLREAEPETAFAARARAIMNLGDAEIGSREQEWLHWLASLDALDRIRRGAQSESASERAECVGVMPTLAAAGAEELLTRDGDELALEKLMDSVCAGPAATFLLYFRARDLFAEDLARLERSTEPALILTAQALHARRDEPVDLALARSAWARVPENERTNLCVQELLIPGLREVPATVPVPH